ncbi:MAG: nickel pincer cofactor biosynthesis protein LarB [Candidatus Omnitrophica bacterium]|nr:nickel pincer cofactor biosynthesis protein LarB [Candidatus Omnitrophota bacterium]
MFEKNESFLELGFAKLDCSRQRRTGLPEIVFAQTKEISQLKEIIISFKKNKVPLFLSRLSKEQYLRLKKHFKDLKYFSAARIGFLGKPYPKTGKTVSLVTAGTSDIPVAEEAGVFLEILGNKVERIFDAGVAGVHRILSFKNKIDRSKIIIVVAGMEGALASLVSGITKRPVIGVPTSIGYGASFNGLASLLGMLNSCSLGVCVVNIDNGLGAGYLAHTIINSDI